MKNIIRNRQNKGITLMALVVTIIILLILAGISISALTNTGLFGKAEEAKQKAENAQIEENETLENYVALIDEITGETLASKVKVGDYVGYTQDIASTDSILEELKTYSGSTENTTSTLMQESDLNWRVLDIKDGKVRLISETPTTSTIRLLETKGYNNAVYLLDKTCSTLYNNETYAEKVQNLKIEDIQEYLTYNYTQYENPSGYYGKYGEAITYTYNKSYPNLFAKEKTGWVDEVQGTELDLSEQITPVIGSTYPGTSIKAIQTYWRKTMELTDFTDSIYYNLFINNGTSNYSTYWISSRCILTYNSNCFFEVRKVDDGNVDGANLYSSGGSGQFFTYSFRPVITLKSDVQIDTTDATKDGTTAENAYVLK